MDKLNRNLRGREQSVRRDSHNLFPHQTTALKQIADNPRPALFMEMRLGKTPVIIRWVRTQFARGMGRVLVAAPMATLDDWQDELEREGEGNAVVRLDGRTKPVRMELAEGGWGWYLINFEGVRVTPDLATLPWDAVLVDESTSIRNPQAKITKCLIRSYADVPYRAVMSGNPAPESPMNYFSQFHFLLGNCMGFGNFWAWRNKYFYQNPRVTWDWLPKPGTRDAIKEYVHSHAVVMTKKQVGIGGTKVYSKRVVEASPEQKKLMRQVIRDFAFEQMETNFATVRDLWLARIAGGFSPDRERPRLIANHKALEVVTLAKTELAGQSLVVWFRFNEELEHVVKELNKAKVTAIGVYGATPKDKRKLIREDFNAGHYQVLCVQIKLGKMGWNLSRANTAIYYSNSYDWEDRSQSQDRIDHPTKKGNLLYIDLVTRGTIEEEVVRLLRDKRMNAAAFMRQLNRAVWEQYWKEHKGETQKEKIATGRPVETAAHGLKIKARRIFPATQTR